MPAYEEISHTPLFIYDPVSRIQNRRRMQLTSAIDIPATILDFHGLEIPEDMQGHSLLPVIRENQKVRDTALFGFHASHVAITDGRYTYSGPPYIRRKAIAMNILNSPPYAPAIFGRDAPQRGFGRSFAEQ